MCSNQKVHHVLLFAHGGYRNRGCEAIIRTTAQLFKSSFPAASVAVASADAAFDRKFDMPHVDHYLNYGGYQRFSGTWFLSQFYRRALRNPYGANEIIFQEVIARAKNADLCVSVGGDNYCYYPPFSLYAIDRAIKKAAKPLVLWGASLESSMLDAEMLDDLRRFDLISLRESISYNALREKGLTETVHLYPDPAFTMTAENLPLPEGWREGQMLGLNISPLALSFEAVPGTVSRAACALVDHILKNTDWGIVLVPHVTADLHSNNDFTVLRQLHEEFKCNPRIVLLGDNYTAPQLKGFISRCRFFVGARTHATIAAYSTGVPTLVLGYSVKARGIARDLFGTEDNLVLPVQKLASPQQLTDAFAALVRREDELRERLNTIMPRVAAKAAQAIDPVVKLINSRLSYENG